jgi:maltose alpha-D-glucosyltransferase/alpha-amylase
MRGSTIQTLQVLRQEIDGIPEDLRANAQAVADLEKAIIERFQPIRKQKINSQRIRCHGDYHLGQVLYTGKDFIIIDFEGEPARSLSERRIKRCPLRDVAGMIRSFHYAAYASLRHKTSSKMQLEDLPVLEQWGLYWYTWVSSAFIGSYLDLVRPTGLLPDDSDQLKILLDAYLLEKAIYEIGYELNNRPEWVRVPLDGILRLMETD